MNILNAMLIVDDHRPILLAMTDYFRTLGFSVTCASRASEAKSLLRDNSYGVLICDLRLNGGEDGLAIIECGRKAYPAIKSILLTACGSAEIEAKARSIGVDAYLNKPQPLAELSSVVSRLLRRKQ